MKVEFRGKKYNLKKQKQQGGKILGEGGFGCVVSPPLKCQSPFFKVPYSIDEGYVSKIVEYDEDDEDILNELKIGLKLNKVDSRQRYFSPVITGCFLEEQSHPDISYLNSSNQKMKSFYSSLSDTSKSDNKCKIYLSDEYLNLISKNSGIDFYKALRHKNPEYMKYFQNNYKAIMHHFCDALMILHRMDILHRDLKPWNIMIFLKPERNKATLNIIDFGLSEVLKGQYNFPQMRHLVGAGTHYYTPLEIFMLEVMIKEIRKNKNSIPANFKKIVMDKVTQKYRKYRDYYLEDFHFAKDGFIYTKSQLNTSIDRKHKPRYANKRDRYKVYYHLLKDFNNGTLVKNFTGHMGHIFKWDVFALGLIFAEIIVKAKIEDELAYDLVNKMVNCKYWERYDIKECLNHPFFKKKVSKTKRRTRKTVKKVSTFRKEIRKAIQSQKKHSRKTLKAPSSKVKSNSSESNSRSNPKSSRKTKKSSKKLSGGDGEKLTIIKENSH